MAFHGERLSDKARGAFTEALQKLIRSGKVKEIARKYGISAP